jgi:hypothetical protein
LPDVDDPTKYGTAEVTITEPSREATEQATGFTGNEEYAEVLAITPENVSIDDKDAVEAALAAYAELSDEAKSLLTDEKAKLDSLLAKITDMEAANADPADREAAVPGAVNKIALDTAISEADYVVGKHRLDVTVSKGGKPYSTFITFTVVE